MARGFKPQFSTLQWVLLMLILACLCASVAMIMQWVSHENERTQLAMNDGHFVRILIENGEIQGKPITTPPKVKAPEKQAKKDDVKPVEISEEETSPKAEIDTPEAIDDKTPKEKTEEKAPEGAAPVAKVDSKDSPEDQAADETEVSVIDEATSYAEKEAIEPVSLDITANPLLQEPYMGKSLPIVSKDGIKPAQYYARPDNTPRDIPAIALTISGLGLNSELTQQAITDLSAKISLSFTPYSKGLNSWVERANRNGHEVWLDIPMEYADYPANDPGPMGLLKGIPEEENLKRLKNALSSAVGYVGVIAPKDEIFTGFAMMQTMSNEMMNRGLLMLLRSRAFKPDNSADGVLYSSRSLIKERSRDETLQSLQELEIIAKDYGYAIGVVDASPALFSIIQEWSKGLDKRNIKLIPLSAVPNRRGGTK